MQIVYSLKPDILYIRFDEQPQELINQRVANEVVLDLGKDDKIVGIEIIDTSHHLNLKNIFPVEYKVAA